MDVTSRSRHVVAAVADLIFGARIRAAAADAGVDMAFARSVDALLESAPGADLLLLDLDARWLDAGPVIERLRAGSATARVPIVAFVSHVRTDAIEAARSAGADRVLARSAFVRELPSILRGS
jgi:CheY-like chemotaxis protein